MDVFVVSVYDSIAGGSEHVDTLVFSTCEKAQKFIKENQLNWYHLEQIEIDNDAGF